MLFNVRNYSAFPLGTTALALLLIENHEACAWVLAQSLSACSGIFCPPKLRDAFTPSRPGEEVQVEVRDRPLFGQSGRITITR
jgi:hypothetical protein